MLKKILSDNLLGRITHVAVIALASACILLAFVVPTERHVGINQYGRCKFVDMVEGRAYRPFVYRALLPITVRLVSSTLPQNFQQDLVDFVQHNGAARRAFEKLEWEPPAAARYLVACILLWLSFAFFAHVTAGFTIQTCGMADSTGTRTGLALLALIGLPMMFRYCSYIYDPPQLLLFTAALYVLATADLTGFFVVFPLACANKETAILLLPVWCYVFWKRYSRARSIAMLGALVCIYTVIRIVIIHVYSGNPGSFVEFHFFNHTLGLFARGWDVAGLLVVTALIFLLSYRWPLKNPILRFSFPAILLPLVFLAMFFGYADEWRGYYEAYPLALALVVDSLVRLKRFLAQTWDSTQLK